MLDKNFKQRILYIGFINQRKLLKKALSFIIREIVQG